MSPPQLMAAVKVIGTSLGLAASLRVRLDTMSRQGMHPIAPHRPGFDPDVWQMLVAYLIEERRLIEFLLGPRVFSQKGTRRYANPDDICLDCFRPVDGRIWRLPKGPARPELRARANRVNKRLTHFSWTMAQTDSRMDTGIWNTKYLDQISDGLREWASWLTDVGLPQLSQVLRASIDQSKGDEARFDDE